MYKKRMKRWGRFFSLNLSFWNGFTRLYQDNFKRTIDSWEAKYVSFRQKNLEFYLEILVLSMKDSCFWNCPEFSVTKIEKVNHIKKVEKVWRWKMSSKLWMFWHAASLTSDVDQTLRCHRRTRIVPSSIYLF